LLVIQQIKVKNIKNIVASVSNSFSN